MQKDWLASLAAGSSYYFAEALECVSIDDEIEDADVTLPLQSVGLCTSCVALVSLLVRSGRDNEIDRELH